MQFEVKVPIKEYIDIEKGDKKHFLFGSKDYSQLEKGDKLIFLEYDSLEQSTGRKCYAVITYIEFVSPFLDFDAGCASFKLLQYTPSEYEGDTIWGW